MTTIFIESGVLQETLSPRWHRVGTVRRGGRGDQKMRAGTPEQTSRLVTRGSNSAQPP